MKGLTYSSTALSNLKKFHEKGIIIYVEGPDDLHFWQKIFSHFSFENIKIKPAGGKDEIKKYSESIIKDGADVVAVMDSDMDDALKTQINNPRIIYTYGYSIENSLCNSTTVAKTLALCARVDYTSKLKAQVELWKRRLEADMKPLIILTLADKKFSKGVGVISHHCHSLTHTSSYEIHPTLAQEFHNNKKPHFEEVQVAEAEMLVNRYKKPLTYLINGHFMLAITAKYVKKEVASLRRISNYRLDNEFLFNLLVSQINIASDLRKADFSFIKKQIDQVKSVVINPKC